MTLGASADLNESVIVAGVGMMPVGEHWDVSLRRLALGAIERAQQDAGGLQPQALYVGNMYAPALSGQTHLGVLIADFIGQRGIEAAAFEAAGASGGVAFRQGYLAVLSGQVDCALVVGVEKVTDRTGPLVDSAIAMSVDADHEAIQGVTPAAQAALLMRRYLLEASAPETALAPFPLQAHQNAVSNPYAIYRRAITLQDYSQAAPVSPPVRQMDAAPIADGAAAVFLTRGSLLPRSAGRPRVVVAGSAVATAPVALHDQPDPLGLPAGSLSFQRALAQAGATPDDLDLFELHDLFSIQAALSLEAAGLAARGQAWRLAGEGAFGRNGTLPILTFGGSKARGDAGGATGVYQLAELTLQLQARAGDNQVPGARVGVAQCIGGAGATVATHVLSRVEG
ncbi:MAG: thiolase domain-containing protein [Anaerolineales bacterium]|nr:thiolase domain-containing protein [Anaerolineales bacterium]